MYNKIRLLYTQALFNNSCIFYQARQPWNAIQEELKELGGPLNTDCVLQNVVRKEQVILNTLKSGPLASIATILNDYGLYKADNVKKWVSTEDILLKLKELDSRYYKNYTVKRLGSILKAAGTTCFIQYRCNYGRFDKPHGWSLTNEAIKCLKDENTDDDNTDKVENTPQQFIDFNHF